MTNESNLQVTFSKRRTGLFKKASEIITLCGVELALVVFSPGNKAFSFGVPSVDTVIDRYLGRNPPETSITSQIVEACRESNVHRLNMELTQNLKKKNVVKSFTKWRKQTNDNIGFQSPVEEFYLSHLLQLKSAMDGLKRNVQTQKVAILNANPQQFYLGSSSQRLQIHDYNNSMMDGGYLVLPPSRYNLNRFTRIQCQSFGSIQY
ncbi:Detected protein of unknown function [Hibiscus syriacus]|uniref:MADS-box domain-containing protein n=1 Tax=Hibiscus syriacus TaxID=106335 RepID=A0A6A3CE81_HIBSY|nr:agamous-like MADS-box protein AGL62 [Hibiscus syriacus]KAE8726011.1 Detected protein of unknown function [Hibiscus syriacus]